MIGLDLLGINLDAQEERVAQQRERGRGSGAQETLMPVSRSVGFFPRAGKFVLEHAPELLLGTAALLGLWWLFGRQDDEVNAELLEALEVEEAKKTRQRPPGYYTYQYLGASPAMRESALRVIRANREELKQLKAAASKKAAPKRSIKEAKWVIRKAASERKAASGGG